MRKRSWLFAIATVMFLFLGMSVYARDNLVIANTMGEPGNLHPYSSISAGLALVGGTIYEPLVKVDKESNIIPCLAESWEQTGKDYIFRLRKNVKFQDGSPFTAADAVFSLKEVMLKSTGGFASLFDSVDAPNIAATDNYTVKVPLKVTDSTILSNLTSIYIIPMKTYEKLGDKFQYKPVGTGPFKLKEWQVGDHITVERSDGYWGGKPVLKTVMFRTIKEAAQAMIELKTGGVDIVVNPQGRDIDEVLKGKVKGVMAVTQATTMVRNNNVNFNWLSEPLRNAKVREALARSVDRTAWAPIISPGNGSPAYSCLPAGVWGYDPEIASKYPYKFDPALAKQLIAEAGYPNGIDFTLLTDERPYHLATVQLLQAALKQINVNLKVQTMDLPQQKQVMATGKGFDLYMLDNLGNASDPISPVWRDSHPRFAKPNSSHNRFYSVNDAQGQKYSDLLDAIRGSLNDKERKQLVRDLQKVFIEDIIWIPVNTIQGYVLASDKISGLYFDKDIISISNKTAIK